VPARLADHGIENRRRDIPYKVPVVADRLHVRIETIRQVAPATQEDRLEPHACALLDLAGTTTLPVSDAITLGRSSDPIETGCLDDRYGVRWIGIRASKFDFRERNCFGFSIDFDFRFAWARPQIQSALPTPPRCKIILYIAFLDDTHDNSSRSVVCLNGALLERSMQCRRPEEEKNFSLKNTPLTRRMPMTPDTLATRNQPLVELREYSTMRDLSNSLGRDDRKVYAVPFETA
jgi:hypothetical protein